jgi:osmotically-inducible protein OsmY
MKSGFTLAGTAALFAVLCLAGCNGNGKTDTPAEQNTVNAANKTADATQNAANKTGNAASTAANNTENTVKDAAKDAAAALVVTPKVSSALKDDKTLSAPGNVINVDSKDNIVHLKGTVQTNELKQRAGEIAQKVLTDNHSTDQLSNELKVLHH